MAARPNAAQQRERRARIALFALLGVLVVVCGIQVPRFLHHGGSGSGSPAAPVAAAPAAPAVLASAVTAAPTATHLTRFAAKDPFHALVRTASGTPSAPASTAKPKPSAQPSTPAKKTPAKPAAKPQPLPALTVPFAAPRKTGKPGALVVLDGRKLELLPGDLIPQAAPILRVVSIGPKRVRVRLLAGTLVDGTSVVTLPLRRKLVLRNTTDGTTFVFRYLAPTLVPPRATPPPKS